MDEISLNGMEFFANHGYYDEEQKIGNRYGVDVTVYCDLSVASKNDTLRETVNYEILYEIVKNVMQVPSRLLEHIGDQIISEILSKFDQVQQVRVIVSKFNPPIKGICHKASVSLTRHKK